MVVKFVNNEGWEKLAADAHLICFNETIHPMQQRVDYALICVDDDNIPMGYMTCRELDTACVYWQHGGAFEGTKGTIKSFKIYNAMADWHKERYSFISTLVRNDNLPMLKMAMKVGFRVTGTRTFQGLVYLEHTIYVEKNINKLKEEQ